MLKVDSRIIPTEYKACLLFRKEAIGIFCAQKINTEQVESAAKIFADMDMAV